MEWTDSQQLAKPRLTFLLCFPLFRLRFASGTEVQGGASCETPPLLEGARCRYLQGGW